MIQAAVARKNLPIAAHGNGADQHIHRANLETVTPALVVEPGSMLVVGGIDLFIEEWSESRLDLFELCLLFDSRQQLLPDQPDHGNTAVLDRLRQFGLELPFLRAKTGWIFAAQRKRPHRGIDKQLHRSRGTRSRRRFALWS